MLDKARTQTLGVDNVRKALRETLDVIVKIVCCLRIDGIAKNVLRMVAGDKLVLQELVILKKHCLTASPKKVLHSRMGPTWYTIRT